MTRVNLLKDLSPRQIAGVVFVFSILLTQSLYWGWNLGCFALADPDSCWLVATGRLIMEQGTSALLHDQFAWTLKESDGQGFVLYQWLCELVFARVFEIAGSQGLLFVSALISGLAFVALPILTGRLSATKYWVLVFVVMLAFNSALYHMPLRPEIFSYLFLSVLLTVCTVLFKTNSKPLKSGQLLPIAAGFLSLFALWGNCHTGFVIGLVYLLCLLLLTVVRAKNNLPAVFVALIAALAGTLCQPYGLRLWTYLPHLFFADINKLNVELQPLSAMEFIGFDLWPFSTLSGLFIVLLLFSLKRKPNQSFALVTSQLLLSLLLLIAAVNCRRLIPFFAISVEYFLLTTLVPSLPAVERPAKAGTVLWMTLPVVAMLVGALLAGQTLQIGLPSSTGGFSAPTGALAYLERKRPGGNLYNDAQYGDLMIYRFGKEAKVFIDTRFDLYGDKLTHDYYKIANARDNWLDLLDEYKIDWLFVMADYQAVKLLKVKGWQELYSDSVSVILQRPQRDPKQALR